MIYANKLPKVNDGVGVLFDTPEQIRKILQNMLGQVVFEDKYLFITGVNTEHFKEYYVAVMKKCEEVNEIFIHEDSVNRAIAYPKMMFMLQNWESCHLLESYLRNIDNPEELAKAELAYHSTDHIVMTLDISKSI